MMMSLNTRKRDIKQRGKREQHEDYAIPHLIKSPTGSETEDSPPYSSSSRIEKDFGLNTRRRLCIKYKQQQQHRHEPRVSNNSILMGAKEIKRQLSCNSNDIDSPTRSSRDFRRSIQASKQESVSRTLFNGDNNDDEQWSPWKSEHDAREKHGGNNNGNDYGNNYTDDDDDTLEVLEKAKAILSSTSDSTDKNNAHTNRYPPTIKKKGSPHNDDKENMKNCMVQRVSELDNSTFASSTTSGNGGYLPTYLISGLACGDDLKSTPCNNRRSQLLNYSNNNNNNTENKDEALETSTLDFLANLHVEEEELNLIFNSFEEEQQELCAQSNCHYASSVANDHKSHIVPSRSNKKTSPYTTTTSSSNPPSVKIEAPHRVTNAAAPFQKMIAPRSSFYDELLKDPAYQHALKAGTLWQSLCSQHVRFPALWWDGQEPASPPLGSSKKKQWAYLGRHRVQGDYKLNSLIGNRGSSGRLLLHLVVRDVLSLEPIEDICCGCFHPNARGVRTTPEFNPRSDDCRDVWLAHRRRTQETRVFVQEEDSDTDSDSDSDNEYAWSTIESLLRHQNKNRVDASPLGALGGKSCVSNKNLRAVFGSKPPVYTVFVLESELYELFQNKLDGSIPASVVLLRHYLRY